MLKEKKKLGSILKDPTSNRSCRKDEENGGNVIK